MRFGARESYFIEIGAGALKDLGETARRALPQSARRLAVISNRRVFSLYGERVLGSLRLGNFSVTPWLMGEGERYKTFRTLESALRFLAETKLGRSDAVIALGGGVVGDLAGLAAALYLRGIAYLQIPTTLLAQIDASVGGKTAVNTKQGKNLIGAFHQPRAVVVDTNTLDTLPPRELTAGWCEAIKHGAVGSRRLFEQTRRFLMQKERLRSGHAEQIADLIAAQCAFKAKIVMNDEREQIERTDHRSRRILNFGHTIAHALEAATSFTRFRHGEAVGYGMLAAGEVSVRLGLLALSELESLRECVRLAGRLPGADDLDERMILERALASDKKAVDGHVQWVLLERIGRACIVGGRDISPHLVRASLRAALRHNSKGGE